MTFHESERIFTFMKKPKPKPKPLKPDADRRTVRVTVYLTPPEAARIATAAASSFASLPEFGRVAMLQKAATVASA